MPRINFSDPLDPPGYPHSLSAILIYKPSFPDQRNGLTSPTLQVIKFNEDFRRLIQEKNVTIENIYNCDETGMNALYNVLIIESSIGTCQGTNVVIDTNVKKPHAAQPGRQEWVTVIECISASGNKIPPYVILKGENLVLNWLPPIHPLVGPLLSILKATFTV